MAKKFLTDIDIAGGIYDSSGDIGASGQVLSSTGSGLNWIDSTVNSSVIYQDAFSGNGSATAFTLANSIDNENKTQVYIDGVYQFKNTYSISGTTLTFSTAPPNNTDIEVISFNSITADGDILTDSEFGSAGLMTTNGSGVYSITTNNSSNWNTAYGWGDHSTQSYATQSYVGTQISNLVDSSPATLNTLNELAAALGDDPNFATTTANSIGTKLPLAGGTLTGDVTISKAATPLFKLLDTTNNIFLLLGADDANTFIRSSSGANLYLQPGGSTALTLLSGGNVGIGVTSPASKLDINGGRIGIRNNIVAASNLTYSTIYSTENTGAAYPFTGTSGNLVVEPRNGQDFVVLGTSGVAKMVVKGGGDVGIGTTSPDTLLHIYNPDTNWGAYSVITLGTDVEGTNQAQLKYYRGASTSTESFQLSVRGTTALTALYNGNVGIGTTAPNGKLHVSVANSADALIIERTGSVTGKYRFGIGGSNLFTIRDYAQGQTRMTIDGSGNVGIGTTSPSQKLEVVNGGFAYIRTRSTSGSFTGFDIGQHSGGGIYLNNRDNTAMVFMTNNTERMNILAGGTGTFYNAFSIQGDDKSLIVRNAAGTVIGTMGAESSSTPNVGMTTIRNNGTTTIQFNSNGSSYINGGSVGIGTTSPSQKLDVDGSQLLNGSLYLINTNTRISSDANGEVGINYGVGNTSTYSLSIYNSSSRVLGLGRTGNGYFAGNVGIGTTSPNAQLHVDGSVHFGPDSGVVNPSSGQLLIETGAGNSTSLLMYTYGSSIFQIQSQGTQGTIGWASSQPRSVIFTNSGTGSIAVGINEGVPAAKFQVSGDRDGNSEYVAILGEDGGANGAANNNTSVPVHKTLLTGYSIPYSGQSNSRLTSVGFLEFDSTPGWTGNQRNWALTSGYDMGGTNGPKFAILMGNTQNVEPQLGINGTIGSSSGQGANTRVAAYWKNTGDMVVPEGGLFVKSNITGETNNANNTVNYLRTITVPYTGSSGSFTFDIDPVAEFGTRVSGGRLHLAVSGWQSRMNAGYIVYRNNGSGSGKIGVGNVTYYRYIWSETSGSQAEVAVSLPSSSTNVIRISFSGWHSNDHGFEARLTATS